MSTYLENWKFVTRDNNNIDTCNTADNPRPTALMSDDYSTGRWVVGNKHNNNYSWRGIRIIWRNRNRSREFRVHLIDDTEDVNFTIEEINESIDEIDCWTLFIFHLEIYSLTVFCEMKLIIECVFNAVYSSL